MSAGRGRRVVTIHASRETTKRINLLPNRWVGGDPTARVHLNKKTAAAVEPKLSLRRWKFIINAGTIILFEVGEIFVCFLLLLLVARTGLEPEDFLIVFVER
jgi:hypothetical protein